MKTGIASKAMNTVEPCTDFDSDIAYYKRWAYSFGLDVSSLDTLRNSGNRAALTGEIDKVDNVLLQRKREWLRAISDLRDFIEKDMKGFADLQKEFAAIIVCVGSTSPRRLKMVRDDAKGVYYAKDFLTYVTKEMLEQNTSVPADTAGKDVVIIGGGDTGIDCAAVAFAQGARSILQLELRECEMTGKTQDGFCELVSSDPTLSYGTILQDVLYDDNGFVKGVRIAKVEWISSASGSLPKPQLIEGSESEIPAQLLLLATGFTGPEPAVFSTFAFNKTPVGTIAKGSGYFDTCLLYTSPSPRD